MYKVVQDASVSTGEVLADDGDVERGLLYTEAVCSKPAMVVKPNHLARVVRWPGSVLGLWSPLKRRSLFGGRRVAESIRELYRLVIHDLYLDDIFVFYWMFSPIRLPVIEGANYTYK